MNAVNKYHVYRVHGKMSHMEVSDFSPDGAARQWAFAQLMKDDYEENKARVIVASDDQKWEFEVSKLVDVVAVAVKK